MECMLEKMNFVYSPAKIDNELRLFPNTIQSWNTNNVGWYQVAAYIGKLNTYNT